MYGTYGSNYSPTLYANGSFFNPNSIIDKTSMSISMWKTTLKIGIAPIIESSNGEGNTVSNKDTVAVFLVPIKAKMLADLITEFMADRTKSNIGIPAGGNNNRIITISNGKDFNENAGDDSIVLRIVEVDKDTHAVKVSIMYEFATGKYPAISGFNEKTSDFSADMEKFKYAEINAFVNILNQYYAAMTNTQAFATLDAVYPYLASIGERVGADLKNTFHRNSNNGFFSNSSSFGGNQSSNSIQQDAGNSQNGYTNGFANSPNNQFSGGLEGLMSGE